MAKKASKQEQEAEVVETTTSTDVEVLMGTSTDVEVEIVAAPKLPYREVVLEGRKKVFVSCPDGCEYELDQVPDQFQKLC